MKVFFGKELVQNSFWVGGKAVPFEVLAGNHGVIVLDTENPADVPVITALNEAVLKRKGGILKISEESFFAKKKVAPHRTSPAPSSRKEEPLRIIPRDLSPGATAKPAEQQASLRQDGPTLEEWLAAGYTKEAYPPHGYAPRTAGVPPIQTPQPPPVVNGQEAAPTTGQAFKPAVRRVKKKSMADVLAPAPPPATT